MENEHTPPKIASDQLYWFGREHTGWPLLSFVGVHRMRKHTPIDPHRLSSHELAVVESGELHLRVDDRRVDVRARQMVVIPPGALITNGGAPNAGTVYWIGIKVEKGELSDCHPLILPDLERLFSLIRKNEGRRVGVSAGMIEAARETFDAVAGKSPPLVRLAASCRLLHEVLRSLEGQVGKEGKSSDEGQLIARALSMLEESLPQTVPVSELARACHMSRTTFNSMFKRVTGVPPHAWISRRRVEIAASHLRNGGETIDAIAAALNFSSPQYFASVFKKMMGVSPTAYRGKRR